MAAMLTGVKGQRHPIIPLAGNIPVAHIVEPILHPLAVGGRLPLHLFCRSNQAGLQLLRANIPGGHQAENHLRFAPPADRIAVLIFHYLIELTGFFKLLKNLIRNIMAVFTRHPAEFIKEKPHVVYRHNLRKAEPEAKLHSLLRRTRAQCGRYQCLRPPQHPPTQR